MTEWRLRVDKEREGRRAEAMLVYAELSKCLIMLLLPAIRTYIFGIPWNGKQRVSPIEVRVDTVKKDMKKKEKTHIKNAQNFY